MLTQVQTLLKATISQGVTNHYDVEIVRKDNSEKIITFNLAPLFMEGNIAAIAVLLKILRNANRQNQRSCGQKWLRQLISRLSAKYKSAHFSYSKLLILKQG
jgi:hypothetical protein